ncbi:MAG TPA: sigma-70 family RNA polymerase sigma factor [Terriglobia bacterium]|nr:sigma-70 family RNA polymerase sigma factor [Terriglobia bacterium]
MPTHLENEATLVADARAGKTEAFTTLVRQYDRYIYRLALNITGNPQDAEDVLQESLLKAYTKLGQFHGESRFYTWLVRIAVNEALMKLRKRASEKSVSLDDPIESDDRSVMPREIEDWADNPEQRYAKVELGQILNDVVRKLEPQFRTVFVLRDIENLSTEETAEIMGLSVPAVKSRLLRARLRVRDLLSPYFKKGKG